MGKYFSAIPVTYYANTLCKDIMRSTQFSPSSLDSIKLYYSFDVPEGVRPDTISSNYYDDPYYDWIVYYSNQIIDPYYEWPFADEVLDDLIITKYGSLAQAEEKVVHYKVNWESDARSITPATYNQFSEAIRQYWKPASDNISTYVRKDLDWKVATNQTVKVFVTDPTVFVRGDYVNQITNSIVSASGEVSFVSQSYIIVEKIEGIFTAGSTIQSPTTGASTTVSDIDTPHEVLSYSIPLDEQVYWEKVTAYDYETQLNHEKRTLTIIDKSYVGKIQRDFEDKIVNG